MLGIKKAAIKPTARSTTRSSVIVKALIAFPDNGFCIASVQ
jgi:hypothetical protein